MSDDEDESEGDSGLSRLFAAALGIAGLYYAWQMLASGHWVYALIVGGFAVAGLTAAFAMAAVSALCLVVAVATIVVSIGVQAL